MMRIKTQRFSIVIFEVKIHSDIYLKKPLVCDAKEQAIFYLNTESIALIKIWANSG